MVHGDDLERAAAELRTYFDCTVRVLQPLPDPAASYDPGRSQYNSSLILRDLVRTCPADAHRLLGLTERDIFIPMLSFVFGQAQLNGKVALVSFARLRQDFYGLPPEQAAFAERARKELLHELGHTFGLTHCADRSCPMSLSTGIGQVDEKSDRYCGRCAAQLREQGIPPAPTEKTA